MIYNIIYNTMKKVTKTIYRFIKSSILGLFPSLGGAISRDFRFYKEHNGRWYVDLPEWKGGKWHLEMVDGADTLLDTLKSTHKNDVTLRVSLEPFDSCYELSKVRNSFGGDGADYTYWNQWTKSEQGLWLCGVTEWFYGFMPEKIYYRKVLD